MRLLKVRKKHVIKWSRVLLLVLLLLSPILLLLALLIILFLIFLVSASYECYFGRFDWTKYGLMSFIENDKIKVIDHYMDPFGWDETEVNYIIHIPHDEDSRIFFQQATSAGQCTPCLSPLSIDEQLVWRLRTGQGLNGVWYSGRAELHQDKQSRHVTYYIYKGENNLFYVKCEWLK